MDLEKIVELAKDICSPVMHMMGPDEYERWLDAVIARLEKEFAK